MKLLIPLVLALAMAVPLLADRSDITLTKEAALEILVNGDPNDENRIEKSQLDGLFTMFERAHKADASDGRWASGVALVLMQQDQNKDAYDWAKKAVKLGPDVAINHYALGTVAGVMADEAGLLSKASYAKRCRKAYERAVELDPDHFPSRVGLTMYYAFAPGIVGGSKKKAYEHADVLSTMEGYELDGYQIKAMIAAQKKDWDAYETAMAAALPYMEPGIDADRLHAQHAYTMFQHNSDAAAALETLELVTSEPGMNETLYTYTMALALQKLGRFGEAIPWYEKTIEIQPGAQNSPFYLGECALEAGDYNKARDAFASYLERAPKGRHKAKAKKGLKRAEKGLLGR